MSFSLLQTNSVSTGGVGVTSQSLAYPNPNGANNGLFLTTREPVGAGNTLLVTDTQSNTWVSVLKFVNGAEQYEMFYVQKCAAGSNTVTVTKSGGGTFLFRMIITEFSGFAGMAVLNSSTSAITTTLSDIGTPFLTPTNSSALLIGFLANQTSDSESPVTASTWSTVTNVDGNLYMAYQSLPNSQPTSWSTSMYGASSTQYDTAILALSASGGGTAVPAFVQYVTHATGVSTATTASVSATITAGNTVVVTLEWNTTAIAPTGVADNLGNTYTAVPNTLQQNASLGTGYSIQNFVGHVTTGGAATITGTWAGGGTANTYPGIFAAEFTNIDAVTPVQTSNGRTGNAVPTSQTISPTGNIVLFGTFFTAGLNLSPTPPWILLSGGSGNDAFVFSMYQIVASNHYNFVGAMTSYVTAGAGFAVFQSPATGSPNLLMMMGAGT